MSGFIICIKVIFVLFVMEVCCWLEGIIFSEECLFFNVS